MNAKHNFKTQQQSSNKKDNHKRDHDDDDDDEEKEDDLTAAVVVINTGTTGKRKSNQSLENPNRKKSRSIHPDTILLSSLPHS